MRLYLYCIICIICSRCVIFKKSGDVQLVINSDINWFIYSSSTDSSEFIITRIVKTSDTIFLETLYVKHAGDELKTQLFENTYCEETSLRNLGNYLGSKRDTLKVINDKIKYLSGEQFIDYEAQHVDSVNWFYPIMDNIFIRDTFTTIKGTVFQFKHLNMFETHSQYNFDVLRGFWIIRYGYSSSRYFELIRYGESLNGICKSHDFDCSLLYKKP